MTAKGKLNVGSLPEQSDDYSQFEESSLRWDRIILVALAVIVMIVTLYTLFSGEASKQPSTTMTETQPVVPVDPPSLSPEKQLSALPKTISDVAHQEKQAPSPETKYQTAANAQEARSQEQQTTVVKPAAGRDAKVIAPGKKTVEPSPIHISNPGIIQAQLSANINDARSVDITGHEVSMSGQNVIKVILFTEMDGLRGRVLYHDWYRNNIRQARVKIPVNVSPQRSTSSKYINQQMLGAWQVKVVDETDTLYLQADFNVISPAHK